MAQVVRLKNRRQKIYIACEEMNFIWSNKEVSQIDQMWTGGLDIHDIARAVGRDVDEVAILVIDRARKERIKPRKGGAFGNRMRV